MRQEPSVYHPAFGTLRNQYVANFACASGDSGAPVYRYNTAGGRDIIGLVWGGSGSDCYFSPVSGVRTDLGVNPLTS